MLSGSIGSANQGDTDGIIAGGTSIVASDSVSAGGAFAETGGAACADC